MRKKIKPYKEPVFLFTSGSLRFAAWAGWYSALGDVKHCEQWAHQARTEWMKEMGAGRRFSFLGRYNQDLHDSIFPERFRELLDQFLRTLKQEVRTRKKSRSDKVVNLGTNKAARKGGFCLPAQLLLYKT